MERTGSIRQKRVAIDLVEERQKCNFDQKELKVWIYGGQQKYDEYLKKIKIVEEEPLFRGTEKFYEMTREELFELQQKKCHLLDKMGMISNFITEGDMSTTILQQSQGLPPIGIHYTMFYPGIVNLCDDDQLRKWEEKSFKLREMLGCYAQTELGHGSNVQGLETTATFDKAKDEFIIHTPTISATKYWPGDMGKSSNFAIVFAKLLVGEKNHGVQPFLVQLRDLNNHECLPGVQTGDVGPKFGYHSKDNGWLSFNQVRIPRTNLLMRYVEVDREGNFKRKGDLRNLYSVMLLMRVFIVAEAHHYLAKGLTISLRYSVVRRQFNTQEQDDNERKLLDYQTQMHKLAPLMGYAFAFRSCTNFVIDLYHTLKKQIQTGDYSSMELCHHLSAGFKSIFTTITYEGLDTMRLACGGAGYSAWSGLPYLFEVYSPNPTFEGDNTLMAQQSSRLIIKNLANIARGVKASGFFSYLNDPKKMKAQKCPAFNAEQMQDPEVLEEALQIRAAYVIHQTLKKLASSPASQNEKINSEFGIDIVAMTKLHIRYLVFKIMKEDLAKNPPKCPKIRENLNLVLCMLGLFELSTANQPLYDSGYFKAGQGEIVSEALKSVYVKLRPQMIPLIESFEKTDSQLTSAIGNSYGDIYETQFEWAKNSRMNQNSVLPGIKDHILPILHGKL